MIPALPARERNAYNLTMIRAVLPCRFLQPRLLGIFLPILATALLVPGLLFAQQRGRKYTPPPPTSKITVTVVKETNGKPVENAAVVFHPMKGSKDEGNLELKTNEEGKATIDVIPVGDTVRLQVIADGFQTFGEDYPITTDSKDIQVKLKRPARQYSIYEKHPDTTVGGADAKPSQPQ
jgi:Carboxypeptidase regulatory-like domain